MYLENFIVAIGSYTGFADSMP